MRVLFAVHHFPPTFKGGAEWRALRTVQALHCAGNKVMVVCIESIAQGSSSIAVAAKTMEDGISIHRLYFNLARTPDPFQYSYRNPLIGRYLRDVITEWKPDVLHLISGYLMSGSTIEAAQAAEVPVVVTLTDFWFLCPRINLVQSDGTLCQMPMDYLRCVLCLCKEKRRLRIPDHLSKGILGRMLRRLWQYPLGLHLSGVSRLEQKVKMRHNYLLSMLNSVDVVISPSRFLKQLFEAQGVCPRRFLYIRQGLDLERFAPPKLKRADFFLRIGYIGQIARHKGVDVLIRAFNKLHEGKRKPRLLIYGDSEQFPGFTRQLQKDIIRKDDIVFAGKFDNSRIGHIHGRLDVLAVPSVWYESSPTVILEAFAAGTPVVASNLGGMAELVEHEVNGLLFKAGNDQDLARQLQRLLDQPELLKDLRAGAPTVKSIEEEVKELIEVYQQILRIKTSG
ncbi:MAG: glycosyltransferase family 4 protein [Anaerolineae bacterium]